MIDEGKICFEPSGLYRRSTSQFSLSQVTRGILLSLCGRLVQNRVTARFSIWERGRVTLLEEAKRENMWICYMARKSWGTSEHSDWFFLVSRDFVIRIVSLVVHLFCFRVPYNKLLTGCGLVEPYYARSILLRPRANIPQYGPQFRLTGYFFEFKIFFSLHFRYRMLLLSKYHLLGPL